MNVLLRFLWLCPASALSLVTEKQLWYEPTPRTWEEARDFCRSEYGDLASIETQGDADDLEQVDLGDFHAWLGLKKLDSGWRWWNGLTEHDIGDVFADGEPEPGHECGKIIRSHKKAYSDDCDQKHFFFCEEIGIKFHFVQETKPWAEAQEHCKQHGWQLLDFHPSKGFAWGNLPVWKTQHFPVWIGQHYDGPLLGPGSCPAVTSYYNTRKTYPCSEAFPFVCQRQNLVLVPELLSWEEALDVCSHMRPSQSNFNLLSFEESELADVLSHITGATTSKVWVGLRFLAKSWFWSDGAALSLPSFPLNQCPHPDLHCGAVDRNTSSMEPTDCSQKLNVLCYKMP